MSDLNFFLYFEKDLKTVRISHAKTPKCYPQARTKTVLQNTYVSKRKEILPIKQINNEE